MRPQKYPKWLREHRRRAAPGSLRCCGSASWLLPGAPRSNSHQLAQRAAKGVEVGKTQHPRVRCAYPGYEKQNLKSLGPASSGTTVVSEALRKSRVVPRRQRRREAQGRADKLKRCLSAAPSGAKRVLFSPLAPSIAGDPRSGRRCPGSVSWLLLGAPRSNSQKACEAGVRNAFDVDQKSKTPPGALRLPRLQNQNLEVAGPRLKAGAREYGGRGDRKTMNRPAEPASHRRIEWVIGDRGSAPEKPTSPACPAGHHCPGPAGTVRRRCRRRRAPCLPTGRSASCAA